MALGDSVGALGASTRPESGRLEHDERRAPGDFPVATEPPSRGAAAAIRRAGGRPNRVVPPPVQERALNRLSASRDRRQSIGSGARGAPAFGLFSISPRAFGALGSKCGLEPALRTSSLTASPGSVFSRPLPGDGRRREFRLHAPPFAPPPDLVRVRRALISLSDKAGLIEAASALAARGVEIVSTGGTAAAIAAAGLAVTEVADVTGYPEMMDGRVKTLHPAIHGALLGVRDAPGHAEAMARHGIEPIDLVWVDLYPFEAAAAAGAGFEALVETIDIGGPAMIRSGAKNHGYVAVCTSAEDMAQVLRALREGGGTRLALR
ncbi:MAG: hypothetical protein H0X27_11595, partial [Caulobacteraceae bacterium]|nr:hypothetical protein [Caulobacteraceae bacterium]